MSQQGLPLTGPLERFKISHKEECSLKEGGLGKWLESLHEDIKVINKERRQRKNLACIDIEDEGQVQISQNPHSDHKDLVIKDPKNP